MKNSKKQGFTLIELIIVIAIIAILAAIAIPNFLSIQRKAKMKSDIATGKSIYDATAALIAEDEKGFTMPPYDINATTGKLEGGYVIPLTQKDMETKGLSANKIKNYLQTIPIVESRSNSHYLISVEFGRDKDGNATPDKPLIRVVIMDNDDPDMLPIADVYPNQSGTFKED